MAGSQAQSKETRPSRYAREALSEWAKAARYSSRAVSPALKSPAGTVLADCGADATRVCEQLASMLEIEAPELAARLRPPRRRLRRNAGVPS